MTKYSFIITDIIIGVSLIIAASFSIEWCAAGFLLLFLFQVRRLINRKKVLLGGQYAFISFDTFFLIMFALCTYIIPILVLFGIEEEIKGIYLVEYNSKYIPYSLFLCAIAVSLYSAGLFRGLSTKRKDCFPSKIKNFKSVIAISYVLATFITLIFLYTFIKAKSAGKMDIVGSITTLINCFIILPIVLCGYMNQFYKYSPIKFVKKYWYILSCALLIAVCMMSIGDRLVAVCLLIPLAFIINEYVYKFSKWQILIAILLGFFLMFLISFTRGRTSLVEGVSIYRESDNPMAMFQDVYPANTCLVLGTEAKEINGLYKPMKIIPLILSPIPFLPSIIKDTFFDGEFSSAMYFTLIYRSRSNVGESGMGSHAVADIYVSWGLMGIIALFFLLGYFVGGSYIRKNNVYSLIIYVGFIAWSAYIPRQSIFDPYRDIVWMVVIYYLLCNMNVLLQKKR